MIWLEVGSTFCSPRIYLGNDVSAADMIHGEVDANRLTLS